MNEKYVTSLELSKKLKEAGVKQESEWYWVDWITSVPNHWGIISKDNIRIIDWEYKERISAFHVGELGEMLPEYIFTHKEAGGWTCERRLDNQQIADNEAEARGKMVLYLKENKLI